MSELEQFQLCNCHFCWIRIVFYPPIKENVGGRNFVSISPTLKLLPAETLAALEKFKNIITPAKSYKVYRDHLHKAVGPCIPYIGVYLSDLTFIEVGQLVHFMNFLLLKSLVKFCTTVTHI
jgi:hypothetical protein